MFITPLRFTLKLLYLTTPGNQTSLGYLVGSRLACRTHLLVVQGPHSNTGTLEVLSIDGRRIRDNCL